jgi:hypothetical protein
MKHADEMRAIALVVKNERDTRMAEVATEYINRSIMPEIEKTALEGIFGLEFELDPFTAKLKEVIKDQLRKHGYKAMEVHSNHLAIKW